MRKLKIFCNAIIHGLLYIATVDAISYKQKPLNMNEIQNSEGTKDQNVGESHDYQSYLRPLYLDHRAAMSAHSPAPSAAHGQSHSYNAVPIGYGGGHSNEHAGAQVADRGVYTSGNGYSYGSPGGEHPPYPESQPDHGVHSLGPPGGSHHGHYGGGQYGGGHYGGGGGGGYLGGGPYGGFGEYGGGHVGSHHKPNLLKGLLIPIAGVALLGVAAALAATHPVLLQLGVVSGRKKRHAPDQRIYPQNPYVQRTRK